MTGVLVIVMAAMLAGPQQQGDGWYTGDERCPPPQDDGTYSVPYNAVDHPYDYPVFEGADRKGWSCSWQREDGVIVQYGNSQTPQEQWLAVWGGATDTPQ